ncbi:MerR family transcriptional regulator [Streptacidiphilus jiangxiensis]|uniref:DNA-binding transcriptional regulator, MerR family n=1 Tax=Streptacidiphilus jiangxiensis TaxID=235985 RepID=A0A1H7Q5K3_STRJI|nr:MerR family transcriptional regulator [Streptacidiphilus jiangxiensis]SEL42944.1 DNA-binding transcriptional regulator, MerR family [Streptacidiphilus jiangxiensis]
MFTIGDFARLGQVSIRMLRHYDTLGLLRPARVDPWTGYRYYEAAQLSRLNRVIALKDLGFSLEQVGEVLDAKVGTEELRGMLRLRQAELAESVALATARLAQVETRLRTIEREGLMPTDEVVLKSLAAARVAVATGLARSFDPRHIGPVIGPLYRALHERLDTLGVPVTGPDIAWYEPEGDGALGEGITVHAGITVSVEPGSVPGLDVVEIPAVERAATIVHHGSMDRVLGTVQTLARWIETSGEEADRLGRELYLQSCGPQEEWVTEIQWPLR